MSGILPTFLSEIEAVEAPDTTLQIPYEYGMDFETGQLTGLRVSGLEAVKVWIWNALHTQRFRYAIYSWDYGADIEQYIGFSFSQEYINTDCRDEIEETLLINPYIESISDFEAQYYQEGLYISFTVNTVFGNEEVAFSV